MIKFKVNNGTKINDPPLELSVQEAKGLPDFTGTDDYFVVLTLNGLVIDKAIRLIKIK